MRAHVRECLCDCLLDQTIRRRLNENVPYKLSNSCNIQICCLSLFTPPVPLPPSVCCLSLYTTHSSATVCLLSVSLHHPFLCHRLSVVCLCLHHPFLCHRLSVVCLSLHHPFLCHRLSVVCLFTPPIPLPPSVCCLSLFTPPVPLPPAVVSLYTTRSSATVCCLSLLTQSLPSRDSSSQQMGQTAHCAKEALIMIHAAQELSNVQLGKTHGDRRWCKLEGNDIKTHRMLMALKDNKCR